MFWSKRLTKYPLPTIAPIVWIKIFGQCGMVFCNSLYFGLVWSELALFFTNMCDIIGFVCFGAVGWKWTREHALFFSTYVRQHWCCLVSPPIPSYHGTTLKANMVWHTNSSESYPNNQIALLQIILCFPHVFALSSHPTKRISPVFGMGATPRCYINALPINLFVWSYWSSHPHRDCFWIHSEKEEE